MNGKVNDYEKLVSSIQKDVTVLEIDLYNQTGCYGLYRNGKIYIEKTLSTRQKKNILAEEYGHYQTSVGTILNQNCTENRKQELKARNVALEQLVTLDDLIRCSEAGLSNHYSCAEFLEIDVETLKNCDYVLSTKGMAPLIFIKDGFLNLGDYSVMVLNTGLT